MAESPKKRPRSPAGADAAPDGAEAARGAGGAEPALACGTAPARPRTEPPARGPAGEVAFTVSSEQLSDTVTSIRLEPSPEQRLRWAALSWHAAPRYRLYARVAPDDTVQLAPPPPTAKKLRQGRFRWRPLHDALCGADGLYARAAYGHRADGDACVCAAEGAALRARCPDGNLPADGAPVPFYFINTAGVAHWNTDEQWAGLVSRFGAFV